VQGGGRLRARGGRLRAHPEEDRELPGAAVERQLVGPRVRLRAAMQPLPSFLQRHLRAAAAAAGALSN
jgi:hypothetical protein